MKYDKEMILKNMSFIIQKGTKVTIAGRTGVGKSTTNKDNFWYVLHYFKIVQIKLFSFF